MKTNETAANYKIICSQCGRSAFVGLMTSTETEKFYHYDKSQKTVYSPVVRHQWRVGQAEIGCFCHYAEITVMIYCRKIRDYVLPKKRNPKKKYYDFSCPLCGTIKHFSSNKPAAVTTRDLGCGCDTVPVFTKYKD